MYFYPTHQNCLIHPKNGIGNYKQVVGANLETWQNAFTRPKKKNVDKLSFSKAKSPHNKLVEIKYHQNMDYA